MSYAIRKDGLGWRAVASKSEVSANETFSATAPAVVAPPVVARITALQGLLVIDQFGLADQYDAWANDPARTFAERAFINKAQDWRRDDATLAAAAAAFGLSEAQVDNMFAIGDTL